MGDTGWMVPGADPPLRREAEAGRGLAGGVVLAGAVLAVSPLLPWAGFRADVPVIGQVFDTSIRGVEHATGWFVMVAGLLAAVMGIAGIAQRRLLTGLSIFPGAAATLALAIFLSTPQGQADFSLTIPRLLEVHPRIEYGWFAGFAASILITILATATLFRRRAHP